MNFKEFFTLFNENIEQNFENWLEILIKYAKPDELKDIQSFLVMSTPQNVTLPGEAPKIIKSVLKEKNLENFNWFSFCVGYLTTKMFMREDLEMAIDVTKKAIEGGTLPKIEIGAKGWFKIGKESKDRVTDYLAKQNILSNKELERRKKRGEADLDENLVKLVATEENIKIYYLPRLPTGLLSNQMIDDENELEDEDYEVSSSWKNENKQKIDKRHQILCSLGKDTEWCTAQPGWDAHEGYIVDDIYIIHENDKPIYQFVSCHNSNPDHRQFMDAYDEGVKDLPQQVFNIVNKYLKEKTGCYNLKISVNSLEDLLNLKDTDSVPYSSMDKLIFNSLRDSRLALGFTEGDIKQARIEFNRNYAWPDEWGSKLPEYHPLADVDLIQSSRPYLPSKEKLLLRTKTESSRLLGEKALIPIFDKLLDLINNDLNKLKFLSSDRIHRLETLRTQTLTFSLADILVDFETKLYTYGAFFSSNTYKHYKKEIEKYKTLYKTLQSRQVMTRSWGNYYTYPKIDDEDDDNFQV